MIEHMQIDVYIVSQKNKEFFEYIHLEFLMRVLMNNVFMNEKMRKKSIH